jgi:pteridine reductase
VALTIDLSGKVALVTGGVRGVGAGIARSLLEAGAEVVTCARHEPEELPSAAGRTARFRYCDVREVASAQQPVTGVAEEFGRLDLLVNNASAFFPVPVGEMEPSHWEELIGSNLRAPLFISQLAAPELAKNEGSIVNIVDIHAERPMRGYALYSVAKAGLAATTRALALELAPRVRVNGVAPGAIAWPEDGQFPDPERARILATTPLGRVGSPEDIAQAVHFLACAPYITGQILAVDGGRSIFI